jgi:hypothetical protein
MSGNAILALWTLCSLVAAQRVETLSGDETHRERGP